MSDEWMKVWQPMIDAIGQDFTDGAEVWGDQVDRGWIRRFLEPLEFDCPLHYDPSTAAAHGYSDVLAPYSGILTWSIPPLWNPGDRIFTSAERNAQPAKTPLEFHPKLAPKTTGYFATEVAIDYLKPVVAGDRLCRKGRVLLSCVPKETRVGRGAFTVWETEIRNQRGELVAKVRIGTYSYNPHPTQGE